VRRCCDRIIPKDAHIIIAIALVDAQSSTTLFENTYQVDRVGPGIGGGIFTRLSRFAPQHQRVQMAIDQALHEPNFRTALAQPISAPMPEAAPTTEAAPAETGTETPPATQ
jgi:hypothetical protein